MPSSARKRPSVGGRMDELLIHVSLVGGWLAAIGLALVIARVTRRADEVGPIRDEEATAPPGPPPEHPAESERTRAA